jgi:hypothetical protein
MEIDDILSQFDHSTGRFPRTAIREAVVRREEVIPALLGVLEDVARDPLPFASQDRMIHIFAMYLLAQFRETHAYPLLVKIFSAPGESVNDLAGDVVTEGLGQILASVSGGDIGGMTALAENTKADEYVRAAAMDGLLTLVACGLRNREEVMAYFDRLFDVFEPEPPMIWNGLASACASLWPEEVIDKIRRAYEEGYIEPGYIGWEDIQDALARGKEASLRFLKDRHRMISDVEAEMGWWACFGKIDAAPRKKPQSAPAAPASVILQPRAAAKAGRNDPCPCGSGKKFKKCCGG